MEKKSSKSFSKKNNLPDEEAINIISKTFFPNTNTENLEISKFKTGMLSFLNYLNFVYSKNIKCPKKGCNHEVNYITYLQHHCSAKKNIIEINKTNSLFPYLCLVDETPGILIKPDILLIDKENLKKLSALYQQKEYNYKILDEIRIGDVKFLKLSNEVDKYVVLKSFPKFKITFAMEDDYSYWTLKYDKSKKVFYLEDTQNFFSNGLYIDNTGNIVLLDKGVNECAIFEGILSPVDNPLNKKSDIFMMIAGHLQINFQVFIPKVGIVSPLKEIKKSEVHLISPIIPKKEIGIFWFDSNANPENTKEAEKIKELAESADIYFEWRKNIDFSGMDNYICFIITSGSYSDVVIASLDNKDYIKRIDIYCYSVEHHMSKSFKKKGLVSSFLKDIKEKIFNLVKEIKEKSP